ncbi:RAQPRD family integrative conjugative element protein [Pseudomonas batumici]
MPYPLPLRCIALVASLTVPMVMAEPTAHERTQLSLVLRQLEAVTRQVKASAALPTDDQARFTFDYARLSADLEQVRGGIEGYLTPSRAQPRTPPELTGHYTRSTGRSP